MLKKHASRNVNRFVGLHDQQRGTAVCAVLSDDLGIARQTPAARPDVPESSSAAISTIARAGNAPTSLWWSVLASFTEGFGAYGVALYPTADFPVQAILVARKDSLRHPGSRELTATGHEHETDLLSKNIRLGGGSELDPRAPRHRNLLALIYDTAAALWAHWRREREIKRAVAELAQFDNRTLRDMGITSRSDIEHLVRYCHDC
ncbi:DUF1127 domain-containing protein [Bradyrhizobium sp. SRL28]|uniref:DUF1127 domain-containing protein n=1 Tax=Bradyrhizobium sp. SRL28 TaxID=2836178 RepID=UPI001BDF515C|nr:DUF1127 domain-containing protein [Bradyrhizobium sp. SRL28]MBT1510144.1 DUF1127 domain-containing protein [Bradyrhizobium sp. SRL28]